MLQQAQDLFIETWLFAREPDWQAMALRGSLLEIDTELPRRVAVLEYAADGAQDAPELRSSQLLQMIAPHLGDDRQTLRTVVQPAYFASVRRQRAGPGPRPFCRRCAGMPAGAGGSASAAG